MPGPLTFIHVPGIVSNSCVPPCLASAMDNGTNRAFLNDEPNRWANRAVTMAPTLWRVRSYSGPGLPSPATSQGSADPPDKALALVFALGSFLALGGALGGLRAFLALGTLRGLLDPHDLRRHHRHHDFLEGSEHGAFLRGLQVGDLQRFVDRKFRDVGIDVGGHVLREAF